MTPLFSLNQVKASIARSLLEANAQGRDNAVVVKVFDDLDLLAGTAIPSYNLTPCHTGVAHDHNTFDATIDAGELPVASEELSVTKKRGVCRRFARFGTCKYGCNCYFSESHGDVIAEDSSTSTNTSDDEEPTYMRDALDFCFAAWRRQTMLQSPAPLRPTNHRMDGLDTQTLPLVPEFPPHLADSCATFYIGDGPETGGSDFSCFTAYAMDKHVTFGHPEHEECPLSASDEENYLFGERSADDSPIDDEHALFENDSTNDHTDAGSQPSILLQLETCDAADLPIFDITKWSFARAGVVAHLYDGSFSRPCLVLRESALYKSFLHQTRSNRVRVTDFCTQLINGKSFVFLNAGELSYCKPLTLPPLSNMWGKCCLCSKCGVSALLNVIRKDTV